MTRLGIHTLITAMYMVRFSIACGFTDKVCVDTILAIVKTIDS